MSVSRYRAEIDLGDVNDSHTLAIAAVPPGSSVLDVGLADGSVEAVLDRLACRVWGIDVDPAAADSARQFCQQVVVGDVEVLDLHDTFQRRFDVVLLLDVLEHLRDPVAVLRKVADVLEPGGWVVVSLPNVAHGAVRLQLLGGRWSYTALGLLDSTHVRFFDHDGVDAMFREAGYAIFDRCRVVRSIDATEIPVDLARQDPAVLAALADDPNADTYQFIVYAAVEGSQAAREPPLLPMRILQERVRALEGIGARTAEPVPMDRHEWLLAELAALGEQSKSRRWILQQLVTELQQSSLTLASEIPKLPSH